LRLLVGQREQLIDVVDAGGREQQAALAQDSNRADIVKQRHRDWACDRIRYSRFITPCVSPPGKVIDLSSTGTLSALPDTEIDWLTELGM